MNATRSILVLLALTASTSTAAAGGLPHSVDTHLLAKLRPGLDSAGLRTSAAAVLSRAGVAEVRSVFAEAPARFELDDPIGLARWVRLDLKPGRPAEDAARTLSAHSLLFERIELDALVEPLDETPALALPTDPKFIVQYALHNTGQIVGGAFGAVDADIDAPEAWALWSGGPVVVGVVDTGVDPHFELGDRLLPGWNTVLDNDDTSDVCIHGTHVAGIIAATRNNSMGMAGICDQASILPVAVIAEYSCWGTWESVSEGIVWAVDHGARIINLSLGSPQPSALLAESLAYAAAADVLVVASAGNSSSAVGYPAANKEAMAIAALDNLGQRAWFSCTGPEIELAAPGVDVYSLIKDYGFAYLTGTSMSAPHVSGVAALLRSAAPWVSAPATRSVLIASSDDIDQPGFDEKTGWGRLNAAGALGELMARLSSGDLNADGLIDGADLGMLLAEWGTAGFAGPPGVPFVGDLDQDGTIDGADLGLLLDSWGSSEAG